MGLFKCWIDRQKRTVTGTFDGNGAEITADCILFAETDGAVIKNVNINSHVYNEKSAGIVQVANNTSIDNCDIYISLWYRSRGL